jgi:3-oxoacyl-[acyl-carrier protein] reductase
MQEKLNRDILSLEGRVAVVTGAAKGIGYEAALTFARAGADVVLADVDVDGVEKAAVSVGETGRRALAVPTDVSQKQAMDALAATALDFGGRIDVWANVAGIMKMAPILETTEDLLDAVVGVNLKGVYWGCAAAGRVMVEAGRGSIINLASAGGEMAAPNISVYALTKAAVIMLTRDLAFELGPRGVRANAVSPGFIDTPLNAHYYTNPDGSVNERKRKEIMDTRANQAPLRITGEASDIAYAMLYLASDASKFMTGQTMSPNGGAVMA